MTTTTPLTKPTKPTLYHAPNFSSCRPLGVLVELGLVDFPPTTNNKREMLSVGKKRKADEATTDNNDNDDTNKSNEEDVNEEAADTIHVETITWDQLKNDPMLTELNPHKRLPFFFDPTTGLKLHESGALVEYFLETYDPKHTLHPAPGDPTRPEFLKLLHFGPASAYHVAVHLLFPPSDAKELEAKKRQWHDVVVPTYEQALDQHGGPFLLGDKLTAADIILSYDLVAASAAQCAKELFEPHPKLQAYHDLVSALPFYKAVYPSEKKDDE